MLFSLCGCTLYNHEDSITSRSARGAVELPAGYFTDAPADGTAYRWKALGCKAVENKVFREDVWLLALSFSGSHAYRLISRMRLGFHSKPKRSRSKMGLFGRGRVLATSRRVRRSVPEGRDLDFTTLPKRWPSMASTEVSWRTAL